MIIMHTVNDRTLPRHVAASLQDRLSVMPAVVVTGARQTGKSTLAQDLTPGRRRFLSLDDMDVLDAARRDPEALVGGEQPVTLDEVQRAPELLTAIKRAIDRRRRPGQFLLSGSANLLLMHRVSESLAGRASYLTLWPMTRRELRGLGRCGIWEELLATPDRDWLDMVAAQPGAPEDWRDSARRGGFPIPALHLRTARERAVWFDGYVTTYLERDLQALASIAALPDFRRLVRVAALRLGQLVNQTELGSRSFAWVSDESMRGLTHPATGCILGRLPGRNRWKRDSRATTCRCRTCCPPLAAEHCSCRTSSVVGYGMTTISGACWLPSRCPTRSAR